MKKIISVLCLTALLASLLMFVGCGCNGKNGDTPPDHKLASKPKVDGYTLYIPEEWTYSRVNNAIVAYASTLNTLSFTAARVEPTETNYNDFWAASEAEIRAMMPDFKAVEDNYGKETLVDGNHLAYIYEYTGTFPTKLVKYRVLQYVILMGENVSDGLVVLTMSGSIEKKETTDDIDFNDKMRTKFMRMLDVIKIGEATEESNPNLSGDNKDAPSGMKNATVNKHLGMNVYVPREWTVSISDGFIGATAPSGLANVGVTNVSFNGIAGGQHTFGDRMEHYGIKPTSGGGITPLDYWRLVREECRDYFDDGTFVVDSGPDIKDEVVDENGKVTVNADTDAKNLGESFYFVYRFHGEYNGERYEMSLYIFREKDDWYRNQFRSLLLTTTEGADHAEHVVIAERILKEVKY